MVRRFDHTVQDDDESGDAENGLTGLPTLPVVVVEQVGGLELPTDVTGDEGATIDPPGPAGTVDQVSFLSLVNGRIPAEQLAGRIVVVGPTARSRRARNAAGSRPDRAGSIVVTAARSIGQHPREAPVNPIRANRRPMTTRSPAIPTMRLRAGRSEASSAGASTAR